MPSTADAREAAWQALSVAFSGKGFASDTLDKWKRTTAPSDADFRFAQELAYGCLRLALALDYMAAQISSRKKLSLKLKEKIVLRMGLYQCCYMTRVPAYAAIYETVNLSNKICHPSFSSFLNAILRKAVQSAPPLPSGDTPEELSIRFSYPELFIKKIVAFCPLDIAKEIFLTGNEPGPLFVRIRSKNAVCPFLERFSDEPPMGILKDSDKLPLISSSPEFYIQNITPAFLIQELCKQWNRPPPMQILDLCSSPGGKLIAVHDQFPSAELYANDVSQEKMKVLSSNLQKYGISAQITCGQGQHYRSDTLFDIVILDVPCSNSGVLNKRAEARWRLTEAHLRELEHTQKELVVHAKSLLKPGGEIWYMTCSLLPEENENLIQEICLKEELKIQWQKPLLPNRQGWDGGYACALQKGTKGT